MEKRGLFQVHLSTIVLLMLAGGVLPGLNVSQTPKVCKMDFSLIPPELRPSDFYTVTVPGFPYFAEVAFEAPGNFTPGVKNVLESDRYIERQRHVVIINIVINVTALLLLAIFVERVVLPRSRLKLHRQTESSQKG